jgi:hypothetical protein
MSLLCIPTTNEQTVLDQDKRQLKFIVVLLILAFVVAAIATYASLVLYPPTR